MILRARPLRPSTLLLRAACIAALCVNLLAVARGVRPAYWHHSDEYDACMRTSGWFGWRAGVAVPCEALRAWFHIARAATDLVFVSHAAAATHAATLDKFVEATAAAAAAAATRPSSVEIGRLLGYRTPMSREEFDASNARTGANAPPKCTLLMVRFTLTWLAPAYTNDETELFAYRAPCGANAAASQRLRSACLEDLCALRRVVEAFGIDARVDFEFNFTHSAWTSAIAN